MLTLTPFYKAFSPSTAGLRKLFRDFGSCLRAGMMPASITVSFLNLMLLGRLTKTMFVTPTEKLFLCLKGLNQSTFIMRPNDLGRSKKGLLPFQLPNCFQICPSYTSAYKSLSIFLDFHFSHCSSSSGHFSSLQGINDTLLAVCLVGIEFDRPIFQDNLLGKLGTSSFLTFCSWKG